MSHGIKRVALLFAGGPAPGANAVISTCAISFIRQGIEVIGYLLGKIAALLAGKADFAVFESVILVNKHNGVGYAGGW